MLGSWLRLNIILLFRRRLIIIIRGLGLSLMLLDLGFVFFVVKILYRGGGGLYSIFYWIWDYKKYKLLKKILIF